MKMKFKTNINCTACLSKVTPVLNANEAIQNWTIDLESPGKILMVDAASLDEDDLLHSLRKVGYKAERVE